MAGNEIHDNGGYAIQFYNGYTRSGVDNNEVHSNRIYNNDRVRQWGGAITLGHGNNRRVYNNIIYDNNGGIELSSGGNKRSGVQQHDLQQSVYGGHRALSR